MLGHTPLHSARRLCVSLVLSLLAACGSSSSSDSTVADSAVATTTPPPTAAATSVAPPTTTPATTAPPVSDTTEPAIEGSSRTIVVQAPSSTGDGIFLLTEDGVAGDQLAPEAGSAKHPDWSPDGTQIVFASDSDGALWTVGADGSDPEQILACDEGCLALDFPAFSPDGRRIAYTRYEPPAGDGPPAASTIRVLDLDTMTSIDVVRIAQPSLVDVARWAPNGEELVVGIDTFDADFNEAGSTIGVVSAAGGEVRELVDPTLFAYAPDWNAESGEIVYSTETIQYRASAQAGDDTWNLWGIAPDGSNLRQITDVPAGQRLFQPTWSPDGEAIVATLQTGGADTRRAVLVDPTTGAITPVSTTLSTHARLQPVAR